MKTFTRVALLVIGSGLLGVSLLAGTPNYVRANLQFSSETRYPKFAGVRQLTAVPAGDIPKYYSKLDFSGGNDLARGALASAGAGGGSRQARTELSGSIVYSYNANLDQVSWVNNTLLQSGEVLGVAPWDPFTTDWPQPPVLTVQVAVTGGGPIAYGAWYISDNNPIGLAVLSATKAADDNVFHGGVFSGVSLDPVEWQDYKVMELKDEDTRQMAEERAKVYRENPIADPNLTCTIGGTPAGGPNWTLREVHVKYRFQGCEVCTGGNLYERRIVFQRRALNATVWEDYRTEIAAIPIKDNVAEGEFDLPREDGYEIRLADLTFEALGESCQSCGEGGLPGGNHGPQSGSISWQVPLGLTAAGESAGYLTLFSPHITPALYTPAALRAAVAGDTATVVRDAQNAVRQVLAPQALADIVVTGAESYEIRFYDRSAVGQAGTDGIYAVSGSAYLVWRISNPGPSGSGLWRVTRIINAQSVVMTEVDESQPGRTVFTEAGGLRVTEATESMDGVDRVEDVIIKNAAGEVSSRKKTWYRAFAWGEERVKEILDPAGAALTTQWIYVTNPNSGAYRKVLSVTRPDGSVESTGYLDDASGQVYSRSVPLWRQSFKDTGYRTSLTDLDGDGVADFMNTVFENMFLSTLSQNITIQWGAPATIAGVAYKLRDERRSTVPGALWNDAGNIITRERYYAEGVHAGELAYRLNPDGTLLLRRFTANPDGGTTTTEEQGAADATGEAVVDGTRSERVLSARGLLVSSTVTDFASGRLLESQTVGLTDSYGRPLRIQHTDGAEEVRSYCASCGAIEQVTLRGETTAFEFDELGRKILESRLAGSTVLSRQRFEYDADSRLTRTYRVNPVDNSETLLASTVYDLAGRVTSTTTIQSGTISYSYAFGASNWAITTTTYPDGGTRIETRGASGALIKLQGTTVAPVEFDWSARSWDGRGTGYLAYVRRFYNATDYVLETSGVNFLGEVEDTTFPDGSVTRRYFDALGRLAREVDQDGVTTLYGYDARGRPAITAMDMNGSGLIDFAGTDRIIRTLYEVGERNGSTVRRSTAQVWETDGQDAPTAVSVSEQSADGLRSWQTVRGLTTSTVMAYDGNGGRTVTTTSPDGTVTTQTYFGDRVQSLVTGHTSLGTLLSVTNGYDDLGRLQSTTDARNGTTTYAYDANERIQTITTPDPDLARSGVGYDPQVTNYGYDDMGRQTTVTQPDGGVMNTTYWPNGQTKRTWGSRTYPVEYTYDLNLRVKTMTTWQDFAGNTGQAVTTWNYDDARGWLNNKRYTDNTGPSYLSKPSGRLLRRTWARGVQTNYTYNAAGDLTGTTYSDGTPAVTIGYDRSGRPKTITDGSGSRTLVYDASGQLKDEDYTSGFLSTLGVHRTFDSLSRLSGVSALNSQPSTLSSVTYGYDAASRLATVTAGPNTATYGYVPNSPLVQSVTFAQSGATRLATTKSYDNLNRLGSISSVPSASSAVSASYAYNSANQRTKATRENNAHWDYAYDALGQVTSGKKVDAANAVLPGHDFAWTYDDIGNRRSASRNASSSEALAKEDYTSNLLNQYTQRTIPGAFDLLAAAEPGATVTYQYPADTGTPTPLPRVGDLLYKQFTVDNTTTSVFDGIRITGVKNNVGPNGEDAVTEIDRLAYVPKTPENFAHDADGNLTADGKWAYTWDAENRLLAAEQTEVPLSGAGLVGRYYNNMSLAGPEVLTRVEAVDFEWGTGAPAAGVNTDGFSVRWTGYLEAPVSGSYVFQTTNDDGVRLFVDGVQLINDWVPHFPVTNTSAGITLTAGQRYPITLEYFEHSLGALVHLRWKLPGAAQFVTIPATALRPTLTASTLPAPPRQRIEFAYDGQSRRIAKKVYSWTGSAWALGSSTHFLYDGWNLLADLDAMNNNAIVCTYAWGLDLSGSLQGAGGVGGLLFTTLHSAQVTNHSACYDGNGNVIAYVDMATGAKSATYEYNAFGETIIADGPLQDAFTFRFSTKYTDEETSLLFFGFRYYIPSTGRWIDKDPMEEIGGINLYAMLANDPVNSWDYLGLLLLVDSDFQPSSAVGATWVWGFNGDPYVLAWTGDPNDPTSGAFYDLTFSVEDCYCLLGKMMLKQQIFRNNWSTDAKKTEARGYTWENVYGHEQQHIASSLAEFRRIRALLEQEKACFSSDSEAEIAAAAYKVKYLDMMRRVLRREGLHGNKAENGLPGSPKAHSQVPPLNPPPANPLAGPYGPDPKYPPIK